MFRLLLLLHKSTISFVRLQSPCAAIWMLDDVAAEGRGENGADCRNVDGIGTSNTILKAEYE